MINNPSNLHNLSSFFLGFIDHRVRENVVNEKIRYPNNKFKYCHRVYLVFGKNSQPKLNKIIK